MARSTWYTRETSEVDEILDTLGHSLRREVVHYFEDDRSSATATVDDLVAHIGGRTPPESEHRLRVQLAHAHLPKLAATGWLEYDRDVNHVRYHGHEHAEQLLADLLDVFSS